MRCVFAVCRAALLLLSLLGGGSVVRAQTHAPATQESQWIDKGYVQWLERQSMLFQARQQAAMVSGNGIQWRHVYGDPQPRKAVEQASAWLLDYPGSVITRPGTSVFETWGDPELWQTLEKIGIDLLHTGPVKRAGSIRERRYTET